MQDILEVMEAQVTANMLRYQVGQQMFCPKCDQCLDWQKAVSIDTIGATTQKLYRSVILCAKCADELLPGYSERLHEASVKAGEPFTIKTADGRDFDEDGHYDPAPPPVYGVTMELLAARPKGQSERVSAVEVKSLPDWGRFVVYQFGKLWFLLDVRTGYSVAKGDTRDEAVRGAWRRMRQVGRELFDKTVKAAPTLNPA